MIELYSTSPFLLSFISLLLLGVLLAVCLKLFRLRRKLRKKDMLAGCVFIPLFATLFFVSAANTSQIVFAHDSQYRVVTGSLVATKVTPGENKVQQAFLTVSLKSKAGVVHKIDISDVLNPFSYTYTRNETSLFDTLGRTYRVTLLDDMILKIEATQE